MILGGKKVVLFILSLFFLVFGFSCFKEYVEKRDYRKAGGWFLIYDNGKSFITIQVNKSQNLFFKKKPLCSESHSYQKNTNKNEIDENVLKIETVSAFLDIVFYEGDKKKVVSEKFLDFNPKFCEGILDDAPMELLKGEQNLGKQGLLLPLYRVGCRNPDWALLDIAEKKFYSLEADGVQRKPLKLPVYAEGGGTIYEGERNFAIASPVCDVCATLSKKGKMFLLNEDGKKLFERNNIYTFCFHPEKKIIYFGCEEGLMGYNWEEERVFKVGSLVPRLIRISKKGNYLFSLKVGGENLPAVFKIAGSGEKIEKAILLDDDVKNADDWIFAGDSALLAIFNREGCSFMAELDLKGGEKRLIESPKGFEIYLINSGNCPTIISKSRKKGDSKQEFYYYDIDLKKFKIVTLTYS